MDEERWRWREAVVEEEVLRERAETADGACEALVGFRRGGEVFDDAMNCVVDDVAARCSFWE